MKRILASILIPLFLLLHACKTEDDYVAPAEDLQAKVIVEHIDATNDAHLKSLMDHYQNSSPAGRSYVSDVFSRIIPEKTTRVTNHVLQLTRYSILLKGISSESFSNLIIREQNGEVIAYIINYEPQDNWIKNQMAESGMANYTGSFPL